MTSKSTPIERDTMQLPILPKGKCVNHPNRRSVKKHLCFECLPKWEKIVLDYEVYVETEEGEGGKEEEEE